MERANRRVDRKINHLPEAVKKEIDALLLDPSNTYYEISEWLKSQGYEVSKSAVGRYAIEVNRAAQRVAETLERTKAIAAAVEKNPDIDYTTASRMVLMDGLMNRISTAEEEFNEIPLEKAGRLVAQLARVDVYEKKTKHAMKSKVELAFKGMEEELLRAIKGDPQLTKELHEILVRAREKVFTDD